MANMQRLKQSTSLSEDELGLRRKMYTKKSDKDYIGPISKLRAVNRNKNSEMDRKDDTKSTHHESSLNSKTTKKSCASVGSDKPIAGVCVEEEGTRKEGLQISLSDKAKSSHRLAIEQESNNNFKEGIASIETEEEEVEYKASFIENTHAAAESLEDTDYVKPINNQTINDQLMFDSIFNHRKQHQWIKKEDSSATIDINNNILQTLPYNNSNDLYSTVKLMHGSDFTQKNHLMTRNIIDKEDAENCIQLNYNDDILSKKIDRRKLLPSSSGYFIFHDVQT